MKQCSKCGTIKDEEDFFMKNRAAGQRHAQCKSCYKEHRTRYAAAHYQKYAEQYRQRARKRRARIKRELTLKLWEYLRGKSCIVCGESDPCVLEFDHIDPSSKRFGIAKGITDGRQWSDILNEIARCRILCANCHKRRTARQYGWLKATLRDTEKRPERRFVS